MARLLASLILRVIYECYGHLILFIYLIFLPSIYSSDWVRAASQDMIWMAAGVQEGGLGVVTRAMVTLVSS